MDKECVSCKEEEGEGQISKVGGQWASRAAIGRRCNGDDEMDDSSVSDANQLAARRIDRCKSRLSSGGIAPSNILDACPRACLDARASHAALRRVDWRPACHKGGRMTAAVACQQTSSSSSFAAASSYTTYYSASTSSVKAWRRRERRVWRLDARAHARTAAAHEGTRENITWSSTDTSAVKTSDLANGCRRFDTESGAGDNELHHREDRRRMAQAERAPWLRRQWHSDPPATAVACPSRLASLSVSTGRGAEVVFVVVGSDDRRWQGGKEQERAG